MERHGLVVLQLADLLGCIVDRRADRVHHPPRREFHSGCARNATETATKNARQTPDHAHVSRVLIAYCHRSPEGPVVDRGIKESMPNVMDLSFMLTTWPTARGLQKFDVHLSRILAWYARVRRPHCEGPSHVDWVPQSGYPERPASPRSRHLKPPSVDSPLPNFRRRIRVTAHRSTAVRLP